MSETEKREFVQKLWDLNKAAAGAYGNRGTPNRPEGNAGFGRRNRKLKRRSKGRYMEIRGIDVSAYNQVTSYEEAARSGIKVAIMRVTERGNTADPTFYTNYEGFAKAGVMKGVYKYSYALSVDQAREEARSVLNTLATRKLEFPVFYDMEWSEQRKLPKSTVTSIIKAFRQVIIEGGYLFGIYCNTDWYYHVLDAAALPYDFWLAAYPYNDKGMIVESLRPPVGIGWQYSSKGRVPGINGYVDLDVFYKDYSNGTGEGTGTFVYTVKAGDTLSQIAGQYHTTVEELARLNHIDDVNLIYVGQRLQIPDTGTYDVWVGACTGNGVNVRTGPGLGYANITGYPKLNKGNLVDVTGEAKAENHVVWYRVKIAGKYTGYVRHDYIRRV